MSEKSKITKYLDAAIEGALTPAIRLMISIISDINTDSVQV
jgi:hypothetical protein